MSDDLYAALGVDPGATTEQIEAAFRRLARQYHPDVNPTPEAADRMREINAAYRELRDPARRAEYDRRAAFRQRSGSSERSAEWERLAAWEAHRAPAAAPAPPPPAGSIPSISLPLIVGAVALLLLAGLALVWNSGRSASAPTAGAAPTSAPVGLAPTLPPPTVVRTATTAPSALTPQSVALARPSATALPLVAPTGTVTPRPSPSPTITNTSEPTETATPTATATAPATPTRQAAPPLTITASEFYNEQETRAGGRKFQLKLTIQNPGPQTLPAPWRPRFLVYAGDRPKGWVEASYYGSQFGGVDISRQPAIRPGEGQTWSWYTVTAGPDEWVRQVEFSGLGWRWTWSFDRAFQNAQVSIGR